MIELFQVKASRASCLQQGWHGQLISCHPHSPAYDFTWVGLVSIYAAVVMTVALCEQISALHLQSPGQILKHPRQTGTDRDSSAWNPDLKGSPFTASALGGFFNNILRGTSIRRGTSINSTLTVQSTRKACILLHVRGR